MTSVTAGFHVGGQGSQALAEEPQGQSYDDGMYHPGNARPAVVADPPNDLSKAETEPIVTADELLDGPGSTDSGMLRGTTTNTLANNKAAAVKPAALPAEGPMDLRQGHFDPPLQLISSMSTSTTASTTSTASSTTSNHSTRTTLHTTSMPTTTHAKSNAKSTASASHSSSPAAAHPGMTSGAQAGVAILVLSLAAILIGMIFWRLHRRKKALLRTIRGEEPPPPTEKPDLPNPVYRFASNLYTSSTCTLVNVAEVIKGSVREKPPFNPDRSSSVYSSNQTGNNLFNSYQAQLWKNRACHAASRAHLASCSAVDLVAEKVNTLRGKKKPDRRSRYSHGYAFAQEFQHVPPPPPTRIQKIVAGAADLYANGSSTVRTVAASFKPQPQAPPPPPPKDNPASTFSSMSSRNPYYEGHQHAHHFQPPCNISDDLNLVKVRSVSSGTVAMSNPADISVDALAGRISGESERTQEAVRESSPTPSRSTAPSRHSQRQSPPPDVSREGSPAYSARAPSTQLEVPSVKLWTKQVYRVEMDFPSRSDGHLQVCEGQMVVLEQVFDDGWALCTMTDTEVQGLLPRACLSTWPIKERRQYASSSNASERAMGSTRDFSPTDSFRFYKQSRPGTPKPGPESKPPSLKKQSISPHQSISQQQSISPTLSTFFRP